MRAPYELVVSDLLLLIDQGRLCARGDPVTVLASPELARALGVVADPGAPGGYRLPRAGDPR